MLYTLSKSQYDLSELNTLFSNLTKDDAVILWQDGVLQAVKSAPLFANIEHVFALENDLNARNIQVSEPIQPISLSELVKVTQQFYPQIAL